MPVRRMLFPFAWSLILTTTLLAQKQESPKTIALPSSTPRISAADLASKVPAAKPSEVNSPDAIIAAIYDVISGPAGSRDWDRFRSLCLPQARFTQATKSPDRGTVIIAWGVEEFIRDVGEIFTKEAFYENGIVNVPDGFGKMRQVLSSYESRHNLGEKPFQRGVNSFQLLNDGQRWWIVSVLWDAESKETPLPRRLTAHSSTGTKK